MFAEEQSALTPLPLKPFRHYQLGERSVNVDGCIEAAYYSVPPCWIDRTVNVQWDGRVVRVIDPARANSCANTSTSSAPRLPGSGRRQTRKTPHSTYAIAGPLRQDRSPHWNARRANVRERWSEVDPAHLRPDGAGSQARRGFRPGRAGGCIGLRAPSESLPVRPSLVGAKNAAHASAVRSDHPPTDCASQLFPCREFASNSSKWTCAQILFCAHRVDSARKINLDRASWML